MAKELICIDTSILIDYYRKKNKSKTKLMELESDYKFCINVITKFEILVGVKKEQCDFWEQLFSNIEIFPLTEEDIEIASETIKTLKKRNKIIGLKDILIASTAISRNLKFSTFNLKDFERIDRLQILN